MLSSFCVSEQRHGCGPGGIILAQHIIAATIRTRCAIHRWRSVCPIHVSVAICQVCKTLVFIILPFFFVLYFFVCWDRDMAVDRDTISRFVAEDSGSALLLKEEAEKVKNEDLKVSANGSRSPVDTLDRAENSWSLLTYHDLQ